MDSGVSLFKFINIIKYRTITITCFFFYFGEGLFLQFEESVIAQWEKLPAVQKQEAKLRKAYEGWRANRNMDPTKGFPGSRFYLMHTISHLFMRELALECGYNAASIQERIYAKAGDKPMAGILVYTAASDSDRKDP